MSKSSVAYIVSIATLVVAVWLGVSIGSVKIPISTLWNAGADATATNILWKIRMPRVVLAGLVGASLAIAGAAFQGLLKNPLADPYTLGVSSGASVGAVMTLFFGISIPILGTYTLTCFQYDRCSTDDVPRPWICTTRRPRDENGNNYFNRHYFRFISRFCVIADDCTHRRRTTANYRLASRQCIDARLELYYDDFAVCHHRFIYAVVQSPRIKCDVIRRRTCASFRCQRQTT